MYPCSRLGVEVDEWPPTTLLARLAGPARSALLDAGQKISYPVDGQILRQGESGRHIVLLLSGMVKVVVYSAGGKDTLLGIRVGGEIVGEMTALEGGERTATVTACRPVDAQLVPRSVLDKLVHDYPALGIEIARMISARLRGSDRRCVDVTAHEPRIRLSRALVDLMLAHGSASSGWQLGVRLTQQEMASLAGMAKRTLEEELRKLRSEGLIESGYATYKVIDMPRLRQIANGLENPH